MTAKAKTTDDCTTIQISAVNASPVLQGGFVVTVVDGPDKGRSFSFDGAHPTRVFVGQSIACELRLSDPLVSRRHMAFELVGDRLRVTDLSSTNGTLIKGIAVGEVFLAGGETIEIGASTLEVVRQASVRGVSVPLSTAFGRFIGASTEIRRLYPLCSRLAASDVPVIIEGETGTGKEVLAEALHEQGPRRRGPFVVFDCTAVPPTLLESELFGHEKGAFTGATSTRLGVFELAHGGTLFIDEIGDLDIALQPKLLRAIERKQIRRVGAQRWTQVDVRILAATRRDLDREVQAKRFRDDLFHRLAVGRIELPPLRSRRGDVAVLANHFLAEVGANRPHIPSSVMRRWEDEPWPGNARELRNAVARYVALGDAALPSAPPEDDTRMHSALLSSLDEYVQAVLKSGVSLVEGRRWMVQEFDRRFIEAVLEQHGGNVTHAAEHSGVARRYFQLLRSRLVDNKG